MNSLPKLCLVLLCSPLVSAAPASDAVNERIPVSRADMEAHWGVDCRGLWLRLEGQLGQPSASGQCAISPAVRHELELCSFIYQPPGAVAEHGCPDYRGLLGRLDSTGEGEWCAAMASFLDEEGPCPRTLPGP